MLRSLPKASHGIAFGRLVHCKWSDTWQKCFKLIMHPEKVLPLKTVVMASVLLNNFIAKRASDVMTQTRLRLTNWNGGWFWRFLLRAKVGVPKTLVKQKLCLHSLCFPQNTLMFTASRVNPSASIFPNAAEDWIQGILQELPGFKPWGSRYESVNYGISNYWFT